MKHPKTITLMAVLASMPCTAEDNPPLSDLDDRINYSLGYQIGGDLKRQKVQINRELLLRGIEDAVGEAEPLMDEKAMRTTLVELKRKVVAEERRERAAAAKRTLEEGEAFLKKNAERDGVVSLPSGLQYRVITAGSGRQPASQDTVTVHYRGTLIDGTEFDSSYSRNQPATFRADRVIEGWRQALPMMQEGARWELYIPARLAYGERGAGKIPSNSTLVFEVELLAVADSEAEETQPATGDGSGH